MMTKGDADRKKFYDVVTARVASRLNNSAWTRTDTADLADGYEDLHDRAFGYDVGATVGGIVRRKEYADRIFHAYDIATGKLERGPRRRAVLYLKADAVPPKGHVLVPLSVPKPEVPDYVARAVGADPAVRVTKTEPEAEEKHYSGDDLLREPETGQPEYPDDYAEAVEYAYTKPEPEPEAEPTIIRDVPRGKTVTVAGWTVTVAPPEGVTGEWGLMEFEAEVMVREGDEPFPSFITLRRSAR